MNIIWPNDFLEIGDQGVADIGRDLKVELNRLPCRLGDDAETIMARKFYQGVINTLQATLIFLQSSERCK